MTLRTDTPYRRAVDARVLPADVARVIDFKGNSNPITQTSLAGTGQSGAAALVNTAGLVLNSAYALQLTQLTSSGAGSSIHRVHTTRRPSVTVYRAFIRFKIPAPVALADWDRVHFLFAVFDPTLAYNAFGISIDSGYDLVKAFEYYALGAAWTPTALNWKWDGTSSVLQWHEVELEVDLVNKVYTYIRWDNQELKSPGLEYHHSATVGEYCMSSAGLYGKDVAQTVVISDLFLEEVA